MMLRTYTVDFNEVARVLQGAGIIPNFPGIPQEEQEAIFGFVSTCFAGNNQATVRAFMDMPPVAQREIVSRLYEVSEHMHNLFDLLKYLVNTEAYLVDIAPVKAKRAGKKKRGRK